MKAFRVITAVMIAILLTGCKKSDNKLHFIQDANGSRGQKWEYEMYPEGILEEVDYYTSRFFLNFGPGYNQNWVFEPIGQGEVTINWNCYHSGNSLDESECYSLTYRVDENLKAKIISDSRTEKSS